MKGSSLVRMSFSIEEELFSELETLVKQSGYENRSEYIRDMIRKQLTRKHCAARGEVIGTISVLCDLRNSGIETKLMRKLDDSLLHILGSTRFSIAENNSSFMITANGTGAEIRELTNSIRKLKGIIQAEFVITSTAACGSSC
jgi:CopG family nickel-responsive transcriptional regulator